MTRFTRARKTTLRAQELRRTASRTERRLWLRLRNNGMGAPFRRQHPVGPFFTDYCCVPLKLVVEVDGPTHRLQRDASRDVVFASLGFDVLHFSVQQVDENFEGVIETIHGEVQMRLLRREVEQRAAGLERPTPT